MISVYISGHKYEHDVFELVRVFYPDQIINMGLEKLTNGGKSVLRSEYNDQEGRIYTSFMGRENTIYVSDYPSLDRLNNPLVKLIKASIFELLTELTGKKLPWGILTGIRPVKLAHEILNKGFSMENSLTLLDKVFKISPENALRMLEIANLQDAYIKNLDENSYSIYVNIPFCPTRCSYCSFPSVIAKRYEGQMGEYVEKLIEELDHAFKTYPDKTLVSCYIGGGTPSSLPVNLLEKIIVKIREKLELDREFTVECGRPDTISQELVDMLSKHKVNRISINPQTMQEETLEKIGRSHKLEDIYKAYEMVRKSSIDHINMDLILGLPGEGLGQLESSLEKIKALDPDNLTIHTLALKKGSKLSKEGKMTNAEIEKMLEYSLEFTRENKYLPYYLYRQKNMLGNLENIGYAKKDAVCLYNILSMEECHTIIGVGMGAVSKFYFKDEDRIERLANFKSIEEYFSRFNEILRRKDKFFKE